MEKPELRGGRGFFQGGTGDALGGGGDGGERRLGGSCRRDEGRGAPGRGGGLGGSAEDRPGVHSTPRRRPPPSSPPRDRPLPPKPMTTSPPRTATPTPSKTRKKIFNPSPMITGMNYETMLSAATRPQFLLIDRERMFFKIYKACCSTVGFYYMHKQRLIFLIILMSFAFKF